MHGNHAGILEKTDQAAQGDEGMHGDGQRQEGKGEHGAADAADTGDETTGEPADKDKDIKSIGHGILLSRPGTGPCPCRRHGSYRALPPAASQRRALPPPSGGMPPVMMPAPSGPRHQGRRPAGADGTPRRAGGAGHPRTRRWRQFPLSGDHGAPPAARRACGQGWPEDATALRHVPAPAWPPPMPVPLILATASISSINIMQGASAVSREAPHRPFARTVL